jgi:hypothetical protein
MSITNKNKRGYVKMENVTQETNTNLDTLTVAQLEAMTKEDLQKAKNDIVALFDAAIKVKAQKEYEELKIKASAVFDKFKTYVLPIIKYGAGAYVLLKVSGVI